MADYQNPTGVVSLNVIGGATPLPGYRLREDPPIQRLLKEVHRIWIALVLAGIPAFLDNWWKTRRADPSSKTGGKGAGAALQGLKDGTLSLTPNQVFTTRVAGGALLFLVVAFLIYAYLEQRKRNHEVIIVVGRHNLDHNRVVTLIPKEKYLLESARLAREDAQRQAPQGDRSAPPASLLFPYEYLPANTPFRLWR